MEDRPDFLINLTDEQAGALHEHLDELAEDFHAKERYGHAPRSIVIRAANLDLVIHQITPYGTIGGYVVEA